jgi:hypothetical protein
MLLGAGTAALDQARLTPRRAGARRGRADGPRAAPRADDPGGPCAPCRSPRWCRRRRSPRPTGSRRTTSTRSARRRSRPSARRVVRSTPPSATRSCTHLLRQATLVELARVGHRDRGHGRGGRRDRPRSSASCNRIGPGTETRLTAWERLDAPIAGVTDGHPLGTWLTDPASTDAIRATVREHRAALATLADTSTAELARLAAETLDTCSHRLDAWLTSLAARRLASMRETNPEGVYLGAYGWVENLRPRTAPRPGTAGGFIHAPSAAHAATAAVLRNAQLTRTGALRDQGRGRPVVDSGPRRPRTARRRPPGAAAGRGPRLPPRASAARSATRSVHRALPDGVSARARSGHRVGAGGAHRGAQRRRRPGRANRVRGARPRDPAVVDDLVVCRGGPSRRGRGGARRAGSRCRRGRGPAPRRVGAPDDPGQDRARRGDARVALRRRRDSRPGGGADAAARHQRHASRRGPARSPTAPRRGSRPRARVPNHGSRRGWRSACRRRASSSARSPTRGRDRTARARGSRSG